MLCSEGIPVGDRWSFGHAPLNPQEKERYLPYPQVGARPTIRVSPGSSLFCHAALFLEGGCLRQPLAIPLLHPYFFPR